MRKTCFKYVIPIMIVSLIFLSHIAKHVHAQEIKQWQEVESLAVQEQKNKEREEKRENLLKRYLMDVLELKNGDKIFGRIIGSASGAVSIFNMETGEEEVIRTNTISNRRKTTADEVKAVIAELRDRGREDEVIPILNKRKEPKYGLSEKSYDREVKSADRAKDSLDKQLDIAHREEREDELAERAREQYLEDRKFDQTNSDNARRSQRSR